MSTDKKNDSRSPLIDGVGVGVMVVGVATLSFLAGSITTEFKVFPYPLLEDAYVAVRALSAQATQVSGDPATSHWWAPLREGADAVGGKTFKPSKGEPAYEGYTLLTSAVASAAWLVDMDGKVVHEWSAPFSKVWPDHPHIDRPVPEHYIVVSEALMLEGGDVLLSYAAFGDTPYGYGLARVNRDSEVVWRFDDHIHHHLSLADDGSIWALTHDFRDLRETPIRGIDPSVHTVLDDYVVRISPDGKELDRFSLIDVIANTDRHKILTDWKSSGQAWDTLHVNSIKPLGEEFASHHDFFEPHFLLLSMRSMNAAMVVDPETRRLVWAVRGPWVMQHDPDPLPNGNIMVYDNLGHRGPEGPSRILEYDLRTQKVVWSYDGTAADPFDSEWGGKQTVLPNGNVLFNEPLGGRILEVNREGEKVWEWRSPARYHARGIDYTTVTSGRNSRIPYDKLDFEPQGPVGDKPLIEFDAVYEGE